MAERPASHEAGDLEAARAEFERAWGALRVQLARQLGAMPRRKGWSILMLAGAVGLATGLSLRRRRVGRELPTERALSRRSADA